MKRNNRRKSRKNNKTNNKRNNKRKMIYLEMIKQLKMPELNLLKNKSQRK
jgi:hypothetical protein